MFATEQYPASKYSLYLLYVKHQEENKEKN